MRRLGSVGVGVLMACLMLSACGGGGGASTSSVESSTSLITSSTEATTTTTTEATTTLPSTTSSTTYAWPTVAVEAGEHCVVDQSAGDVLNVRSGPSTTYPVIGTLAFDATGVSTTGVGAQDEMSRMWWEIEYDGSTGWVASWLLSPNECLAASAGPFCVIDTVCTDRLNVRSGPGTDFDVIGSLAHNATGVVGTGWQSTADRDEVWTQIEFGGGVGWVASWFVTGAPCSPSPGTPCSCNGGGYAFVHSVDAVARFISYDPVVWVWVGPADTDYEWDNSDTTVYWLPLADSLVINACPADMTGPFPPMLYCQPDEFVAHSLSTFAGWIATNTEVGQNKRWLGEVPGHTGQFWRLVVDNCSVTEIDGIWFP
jgi:uncharacterized protein YgiM (DUF1202 family)